MAAPLPNSRLPGTRSTEAVRDPGQLDFFRSLWTRLTTVPAPPTSRPAPGPAAGETLSLPDGDVVIVYVRHPRARRYRLVFRRDGTARCTIPRRGTLAEARRFVSENETWLAENWKRHRQSPRGPQPVGVGGAVHLAGREVVVERLESTRDGFERYRLGEIEFDGAEGAGDLRPAVEAALRRHAGRILPDRVKALAAEHQFTDRVRRVSVRNQRTRWGSCSRRGVISLNWRLVQVPETVRDYIILHELAHLLQMNHSPRFWAEVQRLSPGYEASEAWLKQHGRLLL
jgi:predicted metal-dependent hydrolase